MNDASILVYIRFILKISLALFVKMGRLSSLTFTNFKSYDGTHSTGPLQSFTSIIGPNGAGKSNIMDAISFVLGVRSQLLRSDKLAELIHQDPNKPSRKFAEVQMHFQDDNGSETVFSRRITSAGQSSYSINGNVMRYEQYNAALEERNILVKARNFLVFQGDIAEVASKTPKQFTELFEVISGSAALKKLYDEAEEKSKEAEELFTLTFERRRALTKERRAVRQQKEEVDHYQKLRDTLGARRLEYNLWQLYHLDLDIEEKDTDLNEALIKYNEQKEVIALLEEDASNAAAAVAKCKRELLSNEKQLSKANASLEKKRPRLIKLQKNVEHLRFALRTQNDALDALRNEKKEQSAQIKILEKDLKRIQRELSDLNELLESERGRELKLAESQLTEYNRLKQQAARSTAQLKQQLERKKRTQDLTLIELEKLQGQIALVEARQQEHKHERDNAVDALRRVDDELKKTLDELESARSRLLEIKRHNNEHEQRRNVILEELNGLRSMITEARSDRNESQRESKLNDALSALKAHNQGVRGKLSELCKPASQRLSVALATALGRHMDSVVVDDQKVAHDCVKYMREQRATIATFIPLQNIKVSPPSDTLRQLGNEFQLAVDSFKAADFLDRALWYALGETLICTGTLDDALDFHIRQGKKYKIVTMDGTILHRGGNMSGGIGRLQSKTTRWEEKDVAAARQHVLVLSEELAELNEKLRHRDEEDAIMNTVSVLEERKRNQTVSKVELSRKIEQANKQIAAIEHTLETKQPDVDRLQEQLNELNADAKATEKELLDEEDKIFSEFSRNVGVENVRHFEENRLAAMKQQLARKVALQDEEDRLKQQIEYERGRDLQMGIDALQNKINNDSDKLLLLERDEDALLAEFAAAEDQLKQLTATIKAMESNLRQAEELSQLARHKASSARNELESYDKHVVIHQTAINQLKTARAEIIQHCRLEQIELPFQTNATGGSSRKRKLDTQSTKPKGRKRLEDTRDEHKAETTLESSIQGMTGDADFDEYMNDAVIPVDYSSLVDNLDTRTATQRERIRAFYEKSIEDLVKLIEQMSPNFKADEQYNEVEQKMKDVNDDFEQAKERNKTAAENFEQIKEERKLLLNNAFQHISSSIEAIYSALTRSEQMPQGGRAYLTFESDDEPYLTGIRYTAMPPMKRFGPMEQLSGGERSIAALALVFAIHSFRPAPFFVLDEVDAALDASNVKRLAQYIRERTRDGTDLQCLVISLKESLYAVSDSLCGICRNPQKSSAIITLDLRRYDNEL